MLTAYGRLCRLKVRSMLYILSSLYLNARSLPDARCDNLTWVVMNGQDQDDGGLVYSVYADEWKVAMQYGLSVACGGMASSQESYWMNNHRPKDILRIKQPDKGDYDSIDPIEISIGRGDILKDELSQCLYNWLTRHFTSVVDERLGESTDDNRGILEESAQAYECYIESMRHGGWPGTLTMLCHLLSVGHLELFNARTNPYLEPVNCPYFRSSHLASILTEIGFSFDAAASGKPW